MACKEEEDLGPELKENEPEMEQGQQLSDPDRPQKDEASPRRNDFISVPSIQPLDPVSDSDSENSFQDSKPENQKDLEEEEEDEEVRRYIMEKIIEANMLLQNQEPTSDRRERKLKFKDNLVDLEVPPIEDSDTSKAFSESENNMSGKLSELCISGELGQENVFLPVTDGSCEENDRKILVERDGKFELMSLQDIENQGVLPLINSTNGIENETPQLLLRSPDPSVGDVKKEETETKAHVLPLSSAGEPLAQVPEPPPSPKTRPSSAANPNLNKKIRRANFRTQSAVVSSVTSTYCLSPRQKELQKQLERKREKLKREEEQRKIEEEIEKKRENEMVFKAWLQKKREQVLEMRRVQRAKQIEDLSSRQVNRDPQQAFRLWLKKKHEEQMKERKTEELRKQEECLFFLRGTEGRERAFKQWLRRKQIEKIAEQQAVKERSRQLRLEARRSKQLQSNLYNMPDFRFTDHYN
ncbi:coiled-coil domain-containing protein 181 isoform X2 [Acomys russatus]|nr:coiled-coil domain-containing protein 181 isoform X2 [Acomys russatus]